MTCTSCCILFLLRVQSKLVCGFCASSDLLELHHCLQHIWCIWTHSSTRASRHPEVFLYLRQLVSPLPKISKRALCKIMLKSSCRHDAPQSASESFQGACVCVCVCVCERGFEEGRSLSAHDTGKQSATRAAAAYDAVSIATRPVSIMQRPYCFLACRCSLCS